VLEVAIKLKNKVGLEFGHGVLETNDVGITNAGFFGIGQQMKILVFLLVTLDNFVGAIRRGVINDKQVHLVVLDGGEGLGEKMGDHVADGVGFIVGGDDNDNGGFVFTGHGVSIPLSE